MSDPIVYQLGYETIKDHVFSPDNKILAIARDNTVEIYQTSTNASIKPKLFTVLKGHDKTVTSVDISPDGSKILTCSQDRNALVWQYSAEAQEYKPTLVLLRISRAATVCRWSPDGTKFAVGSSDRIVAVCYYEQENDWWVSKHLKKPLKSTITTLDWHPNSILLACGSTDGHVRVFSAYIKGLDAKPEATVWGSKLPFQTLCGDYISDTAAWIHGVSFSPDGNSLAYIGHDSSVNVIYPEGEGLPPKAFISLKTDNLPFKCLAFLTNNKFVAAGHGCDLVVFEGSESGWEETHRFAKQKETITQVSNEDEEISSHDALNMFRQLDLKGRMKPSSGSSAPSTIHQNTITSIRRLSDSMVSTSGIDGKVVIFTV